MAGHRDPKREAFWRAVLQRHGKSGLNIRAFCARKRLAESAFHAWRRTIRQRDQDRGRAVSSRRKLPKPKKPWPFVPVVLREAKPRRREDRPADGSTNPVELAGTIDIELRGGRLMRIPASMPIERLVAVIRSIEGTEAQAPAAKEAA